MSKQAVVLAGGFGTRLSHIVSDVPKPMAQVGGKPFLDYLVDELKKQGFDNFVFLVGNKAEVIEEYYKNLENSIFIREETPLGTGGAILNSYENLQDEFFVINGDTFFDIDYSILENFAKDNAVTIALRYTNDIERYGFVEIDEDYRVKNFIEKGNLPQNKIDGFINGGIYYIKKDAISRYAKNFNGEFISLETQIFPELIKNSQIYALPIGGSFIDIGIPQDYYRAQELIPNCLKMDIKPALFIDKDGTIIENTEYPHGKNFNIINSTVDIVKEYSQKGYYIVMVTNQAGIAKNKFNFEQMMECFDGIKEYYSKFGLKFDNIEYCPYHKDGVIKEYSFDTLLRKPNAGMILRACEKLRIDLKNSVMIGDNPDIDNIKLPYLKSIII